MKKAIVVILIILTAVLPLTASTSKIGEEKAYLGLSVGYNGVRESLVSIIAKMFEVIFSAAFTAGQAVVEQDIVMDNALALGVDGYFELTPSLSLSTTLGCSVDWSGEGEVIPAPFADMILYWRFNGGKNGDFLLGTGLGTFAPIREAGVEGYLAFLGAMRYQMDITEHMGWWVDMTVGWNAFVYGKDDFSFLSDTFSVMPSLRTGLSYAF